MTKSTANPQIRELARWHCSTSRGINSRPTRLGTDHGNAPPSQASWSGIDGERQTALGAVLRTPPDGATGGLSVFLRASPGNGREWDVQGLHAVRHIARPTS